MKKLGLPLLALALMIPAAAQTPAAAPAQPRSGSDDTVVEEIVARVNSAIITRADLRRAHEDVVKEVQQNNVPNPDSTIAERDKDQLRDLINQQLLIQKGQELGYTADTDLVKRLDEIRKSVGAATMDDLEKAAEQQGVSFEDFKNNLRNQLVSQQVIQKEVGSHVQITPAEVKQFYEQHRAEMEQPELVQLSEILIPVAKPKGPDGKEIAGAEPEPQAVAEAEAKANELEAEIKKGTPFEEVAKKNSAGPTAANGGDLGSFKRGSLAKELEDKTFAMKAGEVTDPIRTKQGFVILKVTEHTQAGVPELSKVEQAIYGKLYYQKLDPALQEYFKKLREDSYIDVKPGFVDSGAVAGQTKPVYTDDSSGKKKVAQGQKKKKRFILF